MRIIKRTGNSRIPIEVKHFFFSVCWTDFWWHVLAACINWMFLWYLQTAQNVYLLVFSWNVCNSGGLKFLWSFEKFWGRKWKFWICQTGNPAKSCGFLAALNSWFGRLAYNSYLLSFSLWNLKLRKNAKTSLGPKTFLLRMCIRWLTTQVMTSDGSFISTLICCANFSWKSEVTIFIFCWTWNMPFVMHRNGIGWMA